MKVILVNDTSLYENHFGCQLVGQTIREHLARFGIELIAALPYKFDEKVFEPLLRSADLLLVNGEGSIHHGKNRKLCELAVRYPAVLMNAVFQENPKDFPVTAFKRVYVRESNSAVYLEEFGVSASVVPDLIFGSSFLRSVIKCEPEFDLGRTDRVDDKAVGLVPNTGNPYLYIREIMRYRRISAGRFHAAVVCAVLNIPFSTWNSNSWKTDGLMKDMGVGHLHFNDSNEALANVPNVVQASVREFAANAPSRIHSMFNEIKQLGAVSSVSKEVTKNDELEPDFRVPSSSLILPPKMVEVKCRRHAYLNPLRGIKRRLMSIVEQ